MIKVDGHLIKEELLKEGDWVLDAGARGFTLQAALGDKYNYLCLDPDKDIEHPYSSNPLLPNVIIYLKQALMPVNGQYNYCGWSYGDGNYIYKDNPPAHAETKYSVQGVSARCLMDIYGINQFGLAKIDCEGSEYDILLSIKFPFAKMICCEFHQCLGFNPYGSHDDYMHKLLSSSFGEIYKVEEWYEYPNIKGMYEYLFVLK